MAWYPGATRMELQPESDAQPAIRPTQFIVHSLAAPWTARRTYEYWRDPTLESHFGLGYEGDLGQYIGTETRADANAAANLRPDGTGAVSIETASNTAASDPWTPEQVEKLIRVGVWMHERHGLPLRVCRSHDDPGYGWHRMFSEWNPNGHACPGDARVEQFREVVFPGIIARATGQEETGMPTTLGRYSSTDVTLVPGQWTTLTVDGTDLIMGASAYDVMVHLTGALPAGSTLQGRFYHLRPDGTRWESGIIERTATEGNTYADFSHVGAIKADEKLRFEAIYWPTDPADSGSVVISSSRTRGLYWT